jgi:hypothetical protein
MRITIIALTAILLAPTAGMASVSRGELAGDSKTGDSAAAVQTPQIALRGDAALGQRGVPGGRLILAKGDQSGNGPGAGGQKGQKKGGHKGKQAEGKDNPGKGKGKAGGGKS